MLNPVYLGRSLRELDLMINDVKRRCGSAVSQDWFKHEMNLILNKLSQIRTTVETDKDYRPFN